MHSTLVWCRSWVGTCFLSENHKAHTVFEEFDIVIFFLFHVIITCHQQNLFDCSFKGGLSG